MKKRSWFILGIVLLVLLGGVWYTKYHQEESALLNTQRTKTQQLKIIEAYPAVFQVLTKQKDEKEKMYPIPGLFTGESINLKTGKKETCHDLTPQGIAVSGTEIYISEYCHLHEHHSVVQVLDRATKDWVQTIIVPGKPHLGGLVYRAKEQQLWLATETKKHASLSLLLKETMTAYDANLSLRPIKYDTVIPVGDIPKASLLAYLDPFLVVGYFSNHQQGKLGLFPFAPNGDLISVVSKTQNLNDLGSVDNLQTEDTEKILKKIQGITYWKNYMLMSQSFGSHNSKLYVFDLQDTVGGFSPASAKLILDFPPYLEQITADGDDLFAMFESGAKAYRSHTNKNVEYALQLDIKTLLQSLIAK